MFRLLCVLAFAAMAVLKVIDAITWSWWLVVAPLGVMLVIHLFYIVLGAVLIIGAAMGVKAAGR